VVLSSAVTTPLRLTTVQPLGFKTLLRDFELHLRAGNISPHTLTAYRAAADQLRRFLEAQGGSTAPAEITGEDIENFLADLLRRRAASTVGTRYWGLRAFFSWLVEEQELAVSPMLRVKPPRGEERAPRGVSDDVVIALLKECRGQYFEDRRDTAMIRMLVDSGVRVGELVDMKVDTTDLAAGTATVMGKGRRERTVAFGPKTASAIARYLRIRSFRRSVESPALWLGMHGPISTSGVGQMLTRRAKAAGVDPAAVHPHAFRHAFAHSMKAADVSEEDLMALGGWRSPVVMRRYAAGHRADRALATHRRLGLGDRF
jgi:site-specific recombinase XerD